MHTDTLEEFLPWFNKFIDRNGGWKPNNIKVWHKFVEHNHQDLRKVLGGIRVERQIKLKSQQKPLKLDEIKPIAARLRAVIPDYFDAYGYTEEVLLMPMLPQGTHNAIRLSKHIRTYASQKLSSRTYLKEIDNILAELGTLWAKARTSDIDLLVTLSTSPKSFILLGHYGPDQDSCFRQDSEKPFQKFTLGQTKNTFTISISKFDELKQKNINVARCFGYTNSTFTQFNTLNYYFSPGFSEGDGLEAITMLFKGIWNDEVEFSEAKNQIKGHPNSIYQNPYANWSFSKGKGSVAEASILVPNETLIRVFICPKCNREERNDTRWAEVDNEYMCYHCASAAYTCELTGVRTFKQLVPFVDDKGNPLYVHPDVIAHASRCSICNIHSRTFNDINGQQVCLDCTDVYYSHCEICGTLVDDDQLDQNFDECVCRTCVEKHNLPREFDILDLVS